MVSAILNGFLKLIMKLTDILFFPINAIIVNLLPSSVSNALNSITQFMELPFQYIGWVFELVHVPTFALELIVAYWVFKYAIVSSVAGVKKVITLYQRFKL